MNETLEESVNKSFIKEWANNYFTKMNLAQTLAYTAGASLVAGLGNMVDNTSNYFELFRQGLVNHVPISFAVNSFFANTIEQLQYTYHPYRNTNLTIGALNSGFVLNHFALGTENPIMTVLAPVSVILIMANYHTYKNKQKNN